MFIFFVECIRDISALKTQCETLKQQNTLLEGIINVVLDVLASQNIDKIKASTNLVNRIFHVLLEFSRSLDCKFEATDFLHLLEESLDFIEHRIAKSGIRENRSGDRGEPGN